MNVWKRNRKTAKNYLRSFSNLTATNVRPPNSCAQNRAQNFEDISDLKLEIKEEPIEMKEEPLDIKEGPLDICYPVEMKSAKKALKSIEMKEEPLHIKTEPLDIKEEPVDIKEEPVDIKKESLDIKKESLDIKAEIDNQLKTGVNIFKTKDVMILNKLQIRLFEEEKRRPPKKPFKCSICGKGFGKKKGLKKHNFHEEKKGSQIFKVDI